MTETTKYPDASDKALVGTYPALTKTGGGYVWDAVLEYRVWCYPSRGANDLEGGSDYYCAFESYTKALEFSNDTNGAGGPLALIVQTEYIDESVSGEFVHVKEERLTEWPVEFLSRPKRTDKTIPDFLSPNAPRNRLDILRGTAK